MNQSKEFLQSENWLAFQAATSKDVIPFFSNGFSANGVFQKLSFIGKYLYVPRGPIFENAQCPMPDFKKNLKELVLLAKEKKAGWIRIEPESDEALEKIKEAFDGKIVRAPRDIQPREIFVIDITRDEATLLAQMKPKTRYNIRLAEKRGVKVFVTSEEKYKQAFFELIKATADRKEINPHPREYYEKFFEIFPSEMCQLFVAEYAEKVLVANICILFEGRAIYLHGGSSSVHRDVMAPYLLQWEQIRYAKERGCREYDFGGTRTINSQQKTNNGKEKIEGKSSWDGITRFKLGFSPKTIPIVFPGSYDMILDPMVYRLYNFIRQARHLFLL